MIEILNLEGVTNGSVEVPEHDVAVCIGVKFRDVQDILIVIVAGSRYGD